MLQWKGFSNEYRERSHNTEDKGQTHHQLETQSKTKHTVKKNTQTSETSPTAYTSAMSFSPISEHLTSVVPGVWMSFVRSPASSAASTAASRRAATLGMLRS